MKMKRKEIFIETKIETNNFILRMVSRILYFYLLLFFLTQFPSRSKKKNIVSLHTIIIPFIRLMLPVFLKRFDIIVITIHLEILEHL